MRLGSALVAAALLLGVARGATAAPKEDPREQVARQFYASGKYREAIDVFAQIYAQRPHPNYLFNIGRCYQNLPDPEHAITSFKDYLRKSPKLAAAERKEIEGYIQEMVELQHSRSSAEGALGEIAPSAAPPVAVAQAPVAASPTGAGGAAAPPVAAAVPAKADAGAPVAAAPPVSPTAAQISAWRARGEDLWKEQAARADDAKLAQIEGLIGKAKADDPRRADYMLFLGRLYAGKHFRTRLKASESRKLDSGGGEAAAGAADRKALDAEANASFLKAVACYLDASKTRSFAKTDEALYQLALILDANNMEARAQTILARLVKTMPDSKMAKQIAASGTAP